MCKKHDLVEPELTFVLDLTGGLIRSRQFSGVTLALTARPDRSKLEPFRPYQPALSPHTTSCRLGSLRVLVLAALPNNF